MKHPPATYYFKGFSVTFKTMGNDSEGHAVVTCEGISLESLSRQRGSLANAERAWAELEYAWAKVEPEHALSATETEAALDANIRS